MRLDCPRCGHGLVYDDVRPRFCSHCGLPLSTQATPPADPATTGPPNETPTLPFACVPRQTPAAAPVTIGGYRLLRALGGGGMGTVYEAEEIATGRRVALKLIRAEFADSTDAVERFRREGRLAGTVAHPRCVFVITADEEQGRPYIVMELMPGRNLHDLVEEKGRLPVKEAVARILDVIEGLQEAHRLGVIHRDVKPSNCFLDEDGSVKVGDFGLAKSLVGPEQLTRSGAFLGTLLYASPEQIRNDQVNHLSDIYSVCATLYYLLTGRAPFYDKDPAATLAKTVTDPLTPMRLLRPELPRVLDEVVLKGLARQRHKRWQSLEELRLALLPFVERRFQLSDMGWRVSAYLIDFLLLVPLEMLAQGGLGAMGLDGSAQGRVVRLLVAVLISFAVGLCYFAVPEALFGATPGKWLMGLRVREVATDDRPSLWRAGLRTLGFYLFKDCGTLLAALLLLAGGVGWVSEAGGQVTLRMVVTLVLVAVLPFLFSGLGLALLAVTMRKRNGYRGLHELLSGTCVIRLPAARPPLNIPAAALLPPEPVPPEVPAKVGAFVVKGAARVSATEAVLRGEDGALGRPVWLWLRRDGAALPLPRRETARPARPRWLAGGEQDGWVWDAFVATSGCLLTRLAARRRLGWLQTLAVLQQLTDELSEAEADGTLPARLSPQQVWVQASGAVQLLDVAPVGFYPVATPLDLLRQSAAVALEGRPRPPVRLSQPIQAPIPVAAAQLLARLMAGGPFASLAELKKELAEAHEHPEEVSRPKRALQVALTAAALGPGLVWMFCVGPAALLLLFILCVVGEAAAVVGLEQQHGRGKATGATLVAQTDVPGRLACAAALGAEADAEARLRERLSRVQRSDRIVRGSLSWFTRRGTRALEDRFRQDYHEVLRDESIYNEEERAELISLADEEPAAVAADMLTEPWMPLLLVGSWPAGWCVWAFLCRGGLGLWLSGLALLGADGRPAPRWRCAWRALLVWAPVVLLLTLSLWLDVWRLAGSHEGEWSAWLAWSAWWAALLLLPAYVWSAMQWPNRGVHDRLAGTYPVPR